MYRAIIKKFGRNVKILKSISTIKYASFTKEKKQIKLMCNAHFLSFSFARKRRKFRNASLLLFFHKEQLGGFFKRETLIEKNATAAHYRAPKWRLPAKIDCAKEKIIVGGRGIETDFMCGKSERRGGGEYYSLTLKLPSFLRTKRKTLNPCANEEEYRSRKRFFIIRARGLHMKKKN